MRFLFVLMVAALVSAAKPSPSIFDKYSSKQLSSAPISLNEAAYVELISTPRDYTAAILLTALDAKYACAVCREFDHEWSVLSRSWMKGNQAAQNRVVFGTLDFDNGKNIFMQV